VEIFFKISLDIASGVSYIDKMNYIRGVTQKKQVAVVVHKGQVTADILVRSVTYLAKHLMRAIRSIEWVAEELIRELTIAELGCKGQDLTSLGEMGRGSLPPLTVTINN
jgi:hypothetical protein